MSRQGKRFFFEKRTKKTSGPAGAGSVTAQGPVNKSFLLLFFQKRSASFLN
jgi:hypothetical protein